MLVNGLLFEEVGGEEGNVIGDVMDVKFILEQKTKVFKLNFAVELCFLFLLHEGIIVI